MLKNVLTIRLVVSLVLIGCVATLILPAQGDNKANSPAKGDKKPISAARGGKKVNSPAHGHKKVSLPAKGPKKANSPAKGAQKGNEVYEREMKKLFRDQKQRDAISKYLDKVPSSRKSRSHASRSLSGGSFKFEKYASVSSDGIKTNTSIQMKHISSFSNNIKNILALIMSSGDTKCDKCDPCPPQPKCTPCPEPICEQCPPCAVLSTCTPPISGDSCPPEPKCEDCNGSTTTTTTTPKPTDAPTTSTTTAKPADSTTTTKVPVSGNLTSTETFTISASWEKHVYAMVSNATIRDNIINMVNEIPEFIGGEEMKLAHKVMSRMGKVPPKPLKVKGSSRTFSYGTARNNVKTILGVILELFMREKCSCPKCEIASPCECNDQKTCDHKPICPPCKPLDLGTCPAPMGCKEHKPCPVCEKEEFEKDFDDEDPIDPVGENELRSKLECKGFTCEFKDSCGRANLNPLTPKSNQSGYIVGGEDSVYGEWPHFARISIFDPDTGAVGLCGGVLISNRHILTAGHCVIYGYDESTPIKPVPKEQFEVLLGEHDRNKKDEFEEYHTVSSVCRSSKWSDPTFEGSRYDFALLTLEKNVTFNDHIQPACLPYDPVPEKAKCYVVGVGITQHSNQGDHTFADILQKLPTAHASCKVWGISKTDRSRQCYKKADGLPGDSCGGDSGGPVVCLSRSKHWTVNGLVSYGSSTCDGTEAYGWVAVYTRVRALMKQINQDCGI